MLTFTQKIEAVKTAKIETEQTHRGWRFMVGLPGESLSMLSYKTEALAIEAAERTRNLILKTLEGRGR